MPPNARPHDPSRIRVTHVGSLPRGDALTEMLLAKGSGQPVDEARLEAEIESAIERTVKAQVDAGIDIANDGEQSRQGFSVHVTGRMTGFGGTSSRRSFSDFARFPGFAEFHAWTFRGVPRLSNSQPQAVGPLRYHGEAEARAECERLLRRLAPYPGIEGFLTSPSPGIIATTMQNVFYASHEEYVFALARELRKEYRTIVESGLVLQIDAPDLALERNLEFQDRSNREFVEVVALHVAAINEALDGLPRERVRLHCCWGASERPHFDDIPLAEIFPELCKAQVGAIALPFSNPRHQHEYAVVREHGLPDHMALIPGVVDNTTNVVEHPEVVANRVCEAVAAVGDPARVIAGVDCGFATFAGIRRVADDVVYAKLRTCREGADRASERLGLTASA